MRRAIELGQRGRGRTAPNPPVGCVLVRGDQVVGEGWHRAAGQPHAEVEALTVASESARGATAYVSLEPCNHHGRTGPCTEALLRAGVARVVLGAPDPNPAVAGGGVARLREAGLTVDTGVEPEACRDLLAPFACFTTRGRPLVTLKVACTLDGRIATSTGHSRWVTGPAARLDTHELRDQVDAILIGAGTARADDPALTCRLPSGVGRDPMRVVLSASLGLPESARLLTAASSAPTVVVTTAAAAATPAAESIRALGVEVWTPGDSDGAVEVDALLRALAARDVMHLMVEGGRAVGTEWLAGRQVDRLRAYVAPAVVGGDGLPWAGPLGIRRMDRSIRLARVSTRLLGDDVCIEGDCVYGDH